MFRLLGSFLEGFRGETRGGFRHGFRHTIFSKCVFLYVFCNTFGRSRLKSNDFSATWSMLNCLGAVLGILGAILNNLGAIMGNLRAILGSSGEPGVTS